MKTSSLSIPTEAIIEDAKIKLEFAREHIGDLALFGLTITWLDQFQTKVAAYEALPSDDALLATQKRLTAQKDNLLKQAELWGNLLRDRCQYAFGSGAFNPFPVSSFRTAARNESKMIQVLPNLIDIASSNATALAAFGQPKDYANQGQSLRNRLDELNQQQERAKRERKAATEIRRQAARTVYTELTHLNGIARKVYRDSPAQQALFKALANRNNPPILEAELPKQSA
ncbi:hypothetical protein [Leptolyngbya sp. FACHB-261]|uniref:hypothetical protein n=1 Tax=Leptolyngbya sp. FACHB-261 TaxID=2692806 RepID=UPI001683B835|nr:hypothetical protein [Leptolyngbya sp. FACHB-261]MBD2101492.1 hypothetical protein [Leptolyngbya sp. FACHB-261]